MTRVNVRLLGRFEVAIDGDVVPAVNWRRRDPAALVKVLALASGRRRHREQVIDALWPDDTLERATPKLHKAAHYARKATGRTDAIVLRGDMVHLFPDVDVSVDVDGFEELARAALAERDVVAAERALARYGGELVPEDRYEGWAEERREQLRLRHLDLLRLAGRWSDVVDLDPADEPAHVALMRQYADAGDRHAAIRQYERLDRVLRRELGVTPSAEAQELRDRLVADGRGSQRAVSDADRPSTGRWPPSRPCWPTSPAGGRRHCSSPDRPASASRRCSSTPGEPPPHAAGESVTARRRRWRRRGRTPR